MLRSSAVSECLQRWPAGQAERAHGRLRTCCLM